MARSIAVIVSALCLSACAAQFPLPCTYAAATADSEIESHDNCAIVVGSTLTIAPDHLERMSFSEHGLAAAFVDDQWRYIKPNGESLPVIAYDNGPDDFAEGLVRSIVHGKVAFYDATFRQVLPPKYDWAWPFEEGRALVCRGCSIGKSDGDGHKPVVGGLWGYIDHNGTEIVPVTRSREEAIRP